MRLSALLSACCLAFALAVSSVSVLSAPLPDDDPEPEYVNPARDVNKLLSRGKAEAALRLADQELAANPQNANLRFLRGVILTDLKRTAEAKAVFEQMIRDYPEIAEPYNNLAVIYAAEGNTGRARELLEQALFNNAKSITTYNNLGDIYLSQAADAFTAALKLSPNNKRLQTKIETIRSLLK